jgi:hypothetical protein
MVKEAKMYLEEGVSVIPVKDKVCTLNKWQQYQTSQMSASMAEAVFKDATGIATIGGKVSGNLEIIDIDTKNDLTGHLWYNLSQSIKDNDIDLYNRLVIIGTPSGGYHLSYRSIGNCSRSGKLANRYATQEELDKAPHAKVCVLIEIKAEGGYCVAPPTSGYRYISEQQIPQVITVEQKDLLLTIMKGFNEVVEEKVDAPKRIQSYDQEKFIQSPFEDYNRRGGVVKLLEGKGWKFVSQQGLRIHMKRPGDTQSKSSGNWHEEHRTFFCFSTSTGFDEQKAYTASGVFCKLECNDNWSVCARKLLELGYGKERKQIDSKYMKKIVALKRNEADDERIIEELKKIDGLGEEGAKKVLSDYNDNQGKVVMQFWTIIAAPERSQDQKPKIKINVKRFTDFVSGQLDIYRYRTSESNFTYVKVAKGIIEEVQLSDIKDAISDYVESLDLVFDGIQRDDLMEVIQLQSKVLFSSEQMGFLSYTNCEILRSTKETAYFPFRNKIAKVTRHGVILEDYTSITGKVIWRKSIIGHSLEYIIDIKDTDFSFSKFIAAINNHELIRIKYCAQLIGYLLHDYKNPANARSVIFGEQTASVKGGGGTGKGLLTTAIGKLVKTVTVDGKSFDPNKPFAFQRVSLGDKIVLLQDTAKNFVFENFYSKITEGLTVEKKNQNEMYIPYVDSPKFLITTNYTINNETQAARRRQYLLEFSNFYSDKHTPFDHLGEYMFDMWDNHKWNMFYSIMLNYCHEFLLQEVQQIDESDSSIEKRIALRCGDDFGEWFDSYRCADYKLFTEIYHDFKETTELTDKEYSRKRFSAALALACELKGYNKEQIKQPYTNKIMYKWG